MNSDFRLSVGYFAHAKVQKLGRRLGDSGVLAHIKLLSYAAQNRPNGVLTNMDSDDIAIASGYGSDPDAFIQALLDLHLLDRTDDGVLELHDWAEHNPWASGAPERSCAGKKAADARWARERKAALEAIQQSEDSLEDSPLATSTHQSALPDAPARNAEPCAPHQSAMRNHAGRINPHCGSHQSAMPSSLLFSSLPYLTFPTPNQPPNPPNPPKPPGPDGGAGESPPGEAEPGLDAGGVEVLEDLLRIAPDRQQALLCLKRHGPNVLRWEMRRYDHSETHRAPDLPPIVSPWDYFGAMIGKPLPYAVRLERDEARLLEKHREAQGLANAGNADREAARATSDALDTAWDVLARDPVAVEEFEQEAQERYLKASSYNRAFFAEHGRPAKTIMRSIRNEMLNEMLAERGLVQPGPGRPAPVAQPTDGPLRLVDVSDSEAHSSEARLGAA